MADLRKIIGDNICALRNDSALTQAQLGDILNYTDKAVSKWERGEAIPDVTVLKQISDYFGVTVDYLLTENHSTVCGVSNKRAIASRRNRFTVSLISVASVSVIATVLFVILLALGTEIFPPWLVYIYAIPVSGIVALVFNSIWGRRRYNFIIVSVLLWSLLLGLYLSLLMLLSINFWHVFIIGAPAQFVILFVPGFTSAKSVRTPEMGEKK